MKATFKILRMLTLVIAFVFTNTLHSQTPGDTAIVYFSKDISGEGILKVFNMISDKVVGKTALKVHFGEEGNDNYLKPNLMKPLVEQLHATFIETNVLYVSKRRYTESHINLAKSHGFDYAPIDILDSDGELEIPVNTKHYKVVKVGKNIEKYQTIVVFSHFKGHSMAGFGGAIKNVSMGLASIAGKMVLHTSTIPTYHPDSCKKCGICVAQCPGGAITINPLKIDTSKCIGCGKCIGECPDQVFGIPWRSTAQDVFLERLVEYAQVITQGRNFLYINVLANISKGCDCASWPQKPFMDDIGVLVSTDIVAIEQASHDLVDQAHQCDDTFLKQNSVSGKKQMQYARQLGMGNTVYKIIEVK